jgi:hypothetical protein
MSGVTRPASRRSGDDHDPALYGQASSLVIVEGQAPPTVLLAKDAVLLAQEVDDLELAGVDPAGHPHDQKPHGIGAIAMPW